MLELLNNYNIQLKKLN